MPVFLSLAPCGFLMICQMPPPYPKDFEVTCIFVDAFFVGLRVEEEFLQGIYQVEDVLLMVIEPNGDPLDLGNQVVE
jgi:hypothetical protein